MTQGIESPGLSIDLGLLFGVNCTMVCIHYNTQWVQNLCFLGNVGLRRKENDQPA